MKFFIIAYIPLKTKFTMNYTLDSFRRELEKKINLLLIPITQKQSCLPTNWNTCQIQWIYLTILFNKTLRDNLKPTLDHLTDIVTNMCEYQGKLIHRRSKFSVQASYENISTVSQKALLISNY